MSDKIDWARIRATKFCGESPHGWPEGVKAISINGVSLLGVHERTNKLYWDGDEIILQSKLTLEPYEQLLLSLAAAGTFGVFLIELGRSLFGWN